MKMFRLVQSYNFKPSDHKWLASLDLQNELIPRFVDGPVLFTVTPTLDVDGQYRGHSYVRCYEFMMKPSRSVPSGGPSAA
jgi:hypothetical protein